MNVRDDDIIINDGSINVIINEVKINFIDNDDVTPCNRLASHEYVITTIRAPSSI